MCPVYAVVYAAADADPLAGATQLAATVLHRLGQDSPPRLAEVRDTIWTFNSPLLYQLLVVQRGWSAERYGAWIARGLTAQILS